MIKIRRVLELGSGDYSTPVFLDKTYFPHLENLISLEDNPEWARKIRKCRNQDERFQLIELEAPISSVIGKYEGQAFDLIFVDNSTDEKEREDTLLQISLWNLSHTIVVIHDYEKASYQRATEQFVNRISFLAFNPVTGIVWNQGQLDKIGLMEMNNILKRNAKYIAPDDMLGWKDKFERAWFMKI